MSNPALLVCDFQTSVMPSIGERAAAAVERTIPLVAKARIANIPLIYIVVGFRPGYPELPRTHPMYTRVASTGRLQTTTPGSDIVPQLAPAADDVIVCKHRVGPFLGTDLDMILRAKAIDTLVLTGIATGGVILSTVRYASDADYNLVVVKDCCADADEEVHRVLVDKLFVRQGTVTTAAEAVGLLG